MTDALTWLKIHALRSWMEKTANEPVEPIIGMSFEKGKALAGQRHAAKLARLKAQIDGLVEATQ